MPQKEFLLVHKIHKYIQRLKGLKTHKQTQENIYRQSFTSAEQNNVGTYVICCLKKYDRLRMMIWLIHK